MIPYLSAAAIREALPFPAVIDALRQAFTQTVASPRRHVHQLTDGNPPHGPTTLLLMPAWEPAGHMGVKLVTVAAGNPARNLPSVHSIYLLFDAQTGVPLAMFDGEELTQRRTAAASALAATYLARPDAETLLIVGTGRLAPYLLEAHCSVRPLRRVLVWGRSVERARALIESVRVKMPDAPFHLEVASDLPSAVAAADIISCATTSTVPIVQGEWASPGCHVDLVGGFRPDMREADDALMAMATVFVDTFAGTLAEAGDLLQPMAAGRLARDAIVAELADLCTGRHGGRSQGVGRDGITVFKSVGSAIEDLCAANLAYACAGGGKIDPMPLP